MIGSRMRTSTWSLRRSPNLCSKIPTGFYSFSVDDWNSYILEKIAPVFFGMHAKNLSSLKRIFSLSLILFMTILMLERRTP
jgi:hypothetical protein